MREAKSVKKASFPLKKLVLYCPLLNNVFHTHSAMNVCVLAVQVLSALYFRTVMLLQISLTKQIIISL